MEPSNTIVMIGRPEFQLPLTLPEVEALIICASVHYDGACKAMAVKAEWPNKSGLLAEWAQILSNGFEGVSGTFRDLDVCLKVMEHPPKPLLTEMQWNDLDRLRKSFHSALTAANGVSSSWSVNVPMPERALSNKGVGATLPGLRRSPRL